MLLLAISAAHAEPAPGDPLYDLEVLYLERKFAQGLEKTDARLAAEPGNKDLYWTRARFLFEIAEVAKPGTLDREAQYVDMVRTVEAGLALAPDDPGLIFARGTAKARLATTRGVLASLFMARDIEHDWLVVAEHPTYAYSSLGGVHQLPCDAFHALGIFYRLVPDRWIVSVLAGTRGDLERSLSFHERAVACKPNETRNFKELAATQLCLGQNKRDEALVAAGKASLRKGLEQPPVSDKDRIDLRHSQVLLDDPSLACGYSRDGQQEIDTSKLESP